MINLIALLITLLNFYNFLARPIEVGDTNEIYNDAATEGISFWYYGKYLGGWGRPILIVDCPQFNSSKFIPVAGIICINEFSVPLVYHEMQHAIDFHRNPYWMLTHREAEEFRAYRRQFATDGGQSFQGYRLSETQVSWIKGLYVEKPRFIDLHSIVNLYADYLGYKY